MKLICEVREKDLGLTDGDVFLPSYTVRRAARGMVLDNDGMMAWLKVGSNSLHKLPGGGLEKGESIEDGFVREVMEETGCEVKISEKLGITIGYLNRWEELHISYVMVGKVVGKKGVPTFTEKELRQGFELLWVKPKQALAELKNDTPDDYEGAIIQYRDMAILSEYLDLD